MRQRLPMILKPGPITQVDELGAEQATCLSWGMRSKPRGGLGTAYRETDGVRTDPSPI